MKNMINIEQWLQLKPYSTHTSNDIYYLKLSNEINNILHKQRYSLLYNYMGMNEIKTLSCFLAAYFEDILSETNIWNTFVKIHHQYYNKFLPFYDTTDYYQNEINVQDIQFLLWYFINSIQNKKFVSPFFPSFNEIADEVMSIFEREYEYAPENLRLKPYYQLNEDTNDY